MMDYRSQVARRQRVARARFAVAAVQVSAWFVVVVGVVLVAVR